MDKLKNLFGLHLNSSVKQLSAELQLKGLKLKLPSESCGSVDMGCYCKNLVSDSNLKQLELPHIGLVCCNLHCNGMFAVSDDNNPVVVSELQSMATLQLQVLFRPTTYVHNLSLRDRVECVTMTSAQTEILKPQVWRWIFVVEVTTVKAA